MCGTLQVFQQLTGHLHAEYLLLLGVEIVVRGDDDDGIVDGIAVLGRSPKYVVPLCPDDSLSSIYILHQLHDIAGIEQTSLLRN